MMTSFQSNDQIFAHRVAAVIVDHGRVLLHRAENDPFWSLPGGRVEMLESSAEALLREMHEELNSEIKIIRLLWVVENFIRKQNFQHHEIGLYYLASLPVTTRYFSGEESYTSIEHHYTEQPLNLIFRWFPLDAAVLEAINLVPVFLRRGLLDLPQHTEHVINYG